MPDYNKLRKLFQDGLKKRKFTNDGQMVKFRAADSANSSNEKASNDLSTFKVGKTISIYMYCLLLENSCTTR